MPAFICTACGTQYPPSDAPPSGCVICEEERQFVPLAGQGWTTLEALRVRNFNAWRQHEAGLIGIGTEPTFAIGQRALLIQTPHGNVLWDCISLIDDATVTLTNGLGGLKAIAISHPHFYTTMTEWSRAFGGVPRLRLTRRFYKLRQHPAAEHGSATTSVVNAGTPPSFSGEWGGEHGGRRVTGRRTGARARWR
jgi:hypothetical protein